MIVPTLHPRTSLIVGLLSLTTLATAACRRQQSQPVSPQPNVQTDGNPANSDSLERAEAARRDSLAREERARAERERRLNEARATLMQAVYFGYDRSDLTPEAKRALDAKLTPFDGQCRGPPPDFGPRGRAGIGRVQPGARPESCGRGETLSR